MDTKVSFIVASVPCLRHKKDVTEPCWTAPARGDHNPRIMGVCMHRAAMSGILLPQVKQQVLKAA